VVPVLVFCNTISAVGVVSKLLAKHYGGGSGGGGVRALHGNMPQADREATLRAFVRGSAKPSSSSSHGSHGSHGSHSSGQGCHTLVATDVAARGLHMPRLQHVLNYDFPPSLEQVREELAFVGRGQLFC
jgi:superfamily II DNA/RNA helicase